MRMRLGFILFSAVLGAAILPGVASAQAAPADPSFSDIARGTLTRARRAIAIGPIVGIGVAYAPTPDEADVPISFGLAVYSFKIPVLPDPALVKELIVERTKAKVIERAKQMIAEGKPAPDQAELERMAREVFEEVKAEVLGQLSARPKVWERPAYTLALEGVYFTSSEAWQTRLTLGIGIKGFTIGPSLVGHFADENGMYLGGELAVHLLPTKSPRSPVVDVFVRYDFGVTEATTEADQLTFGARFLLDII